MWIRIVNDPANEPSKRAPLPPRESGGSGGLRAQMRKAGSSIRWRWRRFVVGHVQLLIAAVVAATTAGAVLSPVLQSWARGTILYGSDPVSGQIVIRPFKVNHAVRGATVRLVPAGVQSLGAALHLSARGERAAVVQTSTDFAGRWAADAGLIAGWRYAVIVEAEKCAPQLAGTVEVGWLTASRVQITMRSCRERENTLKLPTQQRQQDG